MSNLKDRYNSSLENGADTKAPSSSKLLEKYDAYKASSYRPQSNVQTPQKEQTLYTTKSGRNITMSTLSDWANPRYKAGKDEQAEIKEFLNSTRRMNPKKSVNGWDMDTQLNVDALRPAVSRQLPSVAKLTSFSTGLAEGLLPFLDVAKANERQAARDAKKSAKDGNYNYYNGEADWYRKAADENKVANVAGRLGGSMAVYKGASSLPAVGKIAEGATKALGGGKVAGYLGNLIADTSVDLGLDTLPQIVSDVREGKSGKDVAKGAAGNLAANVGFNIGGDALGRLIGKAIDKKNAQNVVDAVKKDAKQPLDETTQSIANLLKGGDAEAQMQKRILEEANANKVTSLADFQKEIDSARQAKEAEEAFAKRLLEEQNAQPSDLNSLMEQFNQMNGAKTADTLADSAVATGKNANTTIPTLKENTALKTASSESVPKTDFSTKKVSDRTLDRVMNDHFNMYAKQMPELKADLKAAINEYEQTFFKEALDRINELTARAEKQMTGGVYNRVRDAGKRSGKTSPISYPNSRGTITENVMGYIDSLNAKHAITSSGATYDDDMKALADLIPKNSDESAVLWENLSNLKQSLDGYAKSGDEAYLDKAIEDITDFVKSGTIDYADAQLPFETAIKKSVDAFQAKPVRNVADSTGLNNISKRIAEEQNAKTVSAIPEETQNAVKNNSYVPETAKADVEVEGDIGDSVSRYSGVTLINKGDLPEEIKDVFRENPSLYKALKNADTSKAAEEIINNTDTNEAIKIYNDLLAKKDAVSVPLGYDIAKRLIADGNYDGAVDILDKLSKELTKSGQFTQAAAIRLVDADPMAAMRLMQRQIKKINDFGADKFKKWTDFALTDDEIKAFGEIDPGDAVAVEKLFDKIQKRIALSMPTTTWQKIVEATKLAMMFNPRTHIRNIAANTIFVPVRSLTDRVSAVGQNIAHLIDPNVKVTQSLIGGTKAQKEIAGQIYENQIVDMLSNDHSKWQDVALGVEREKQIFKDSAIGNALKEPTKKFAEKNLKIINFLTGGKIQNVIDNLDDSVKGSFLENLRRFDYYLLGEVEDNPFVKKNFVNRLASYMKAQNINAIDDVPNDAIQTAYQEALKATFKDDNYMTKAFSGLKQSMGKLGEVSLPFVKTPANIAKRGLEFSPFGFVDTAVHAKGKTADAIIDDLSKNAVGTAGILLGVALARKGLIQGALAKDTDEKQFEKQQGKQAFSINLNGKYYTFDWAQPATIPIIIGATINDVIEESDRENADYLNIAKQSATAAIDSWVDLSPLSSLKEILGGNGYGKNSVGENVIDAATEFPLRLLPSLGNAIAKTQDPIERLTTVNDKPGQTLINKAKSKIPGLSQTLPAKYNTWGQEIKRQNSTADALFANFLNPGSFGYDASTPIDAEIQRLANDVGTVSVYPRVADKTVGDKKLSPQEISNYQREMGQHSYELAEKFINSQIYKDIDDSRRADVMSKLYSAASAVAEKDLFGKEYPSTYKKYAEIYKNEGADALIEHITKSEKFSERDLSTASSKNQRIYDAKSDEGLDVLSNIKKEYETVSPKTAYKYFESQGSIPTLEAGEYLYMLDETAKGHSKGVQNAYDKGGYSAVYDYYTIKENADANENGSLTKGEIHDYLSALGMDEAHINAWLEVFGK